VISRIKLKNQKSKIKMQNDKSKIKNIALGVFQVCLQLFSGWLVLPGFWPGVGTYGFCFLPPSKREGHRAREE